MSVRLISSQARHLVVSKINKWRELISAARNHPHRHLFPFETTKNVDALEAAAQVYHNFLSDPVWAASAEEPAHIGFPADKNKNLFGKAVTGVVILYKDNFYSVKGPYTPDEAILVFSDFIKKKKTRIECLRQTSDMTTLGGKSMRERLAEGVRNEVWRRDQGKCVSCSSNQKLEFDHIIPVSRGGSNTARNIQLLCENCNRRKSNLIG